MTAPITSNTLGVNVFTAPGKAMITTRHGLACFKIRIFG